MNWTPPEGILEYVLKVYCCREWEVSLLNPFWGRCGLCGERPGACYSFG